MTNLQPSRQEWDAVKGVLILCVLVGHSALANVVAPALKDGLYSFHVQAFLLLPFLYAVRPAGGRNVADVCVRYLIPYSVFVAVFSVLQQVAVRRDVVSWLYELERGLITGNDVYLKGATGLSLFWFLPAITGVSLLTILYYSRAGFCCTRLLGQPESLWGQVTLSTASIVAAVVGPLSVMCVLDAMPRLKQMVFPRHAEDFFGSPAEAAVVCS